MACTISPCRFRTHRGRVADLAPVALPREVESRYLYQIINTVSSTLDLDRVLRAIVDLVSEAIDCHACFIYAVEPDSSLVLRAVSDPYGALVGRLRFEPGEGLSGWVAANNQPVFISENALADPRVKIVPEAEEEKYQSLCGAPLNAKSGEVIGVIALHAEAPKEFTQSDVEFLVHAASLVAGAIENARLFEETTRRLAVVEGLSDLSRAVAGATTMEALLAAVTRRAQRLLGADLLPGLRRGSHPGTRLMVGASWPQMPARDPIAPGRAGCRAGHRHPPDDGAGGPPPGRDAVGRELRGLRGRRAAGRRRGAGRAAGAARCLPAGRSTPRSAS